jgi:4-hydroxy-tetrahydrodipicolinate synthase
MATPFDADGRIDESGVQRLVDHLLENGSDESPTLSHDEKLRMFRLVKDAAQGRGAVIAGTGSNDTAASVTLAREAAEIGVDGLLLVAPYYNKPPQEGMVRHFRAIAEAVDLPVMLYNVPPRTSSNIEAATVLRLAREVPNVVAVKEASGNLQQVTEIVAGAPEGFLVYSGDDLLTLPMLAVGGYGVVSVSAHLVGPDMQAMHRAFFGGEVAEAARLHSKMLPIVKALFQPTTPSPVPLKAGLEMIGVPCGPLRLPLVEANQRERDLMAQALREYGLLRDGQN